MASINAASNSNNKWKVKVSNPQYRKHVFIWSGSAVSSEAASIKALEAARSILQFSTGLKNSNPRSWYNILIVHSTEVQDNYLSSATSWKISPEMAGHINQFAPLRLNYIDTKLLANICSSILAEDSGILRMPHGSYAEIEINDSRGISYNDRHIYKYVYPFHYDLELDYQTEFALLTLNCILEFGCRGHWALRTINFTPPQSATLRAAGRSSAHLRTKQAIKFMKQWGAHIAADQLALRGRNVLI